jgi:hypothetical protein
MEIATSHVPDGSKEGIVLACHSDRLRSTLTLYVYMVLVPLPAERFT